MSPIIYLGNISIGLAIGLSLFGGILFFAARDKESNSIAWWGRAAVYTNFVLMTIANLAMIYALLANDFSVSYVAHVGARETPRWISAISLWSSLEGSILFWGWILSAYAAICIYLYRKRTGPMMKGVGLVLLFVELFFFLLLALPANPFQPVFPIPANGPGPNPLLQNHWLMAVHPPCLYLGYIGFTVPFAFAIATLAKPTSFPSPLGGRGWSAEGGPGEGTTWITLVRPWTLFAWSFLSIAIVLGGWWSYAVLGWGGYWAWDPVENASFMPWLTGTALLHSMIVQERRKLFPLWNLTLVILTFLLTLLGTFLTRSGVLDSVHSFTESHIGPYFLVFIGLLLSLSIALLLWKGPDQEKNGARIENLFSLEVLFLINNLLFLGFCFVVFLGTLYPLVVEALSGKRISVGEPYFNQMTVPLIGLILLLMGIAIVTPWKKGSLQTLRSLRLPGLLSLLPVIIALFKGITHPAVLFILFLASTAFFVMTFEWFRLGREHGPLRLLFKNPRRYGGFIAHAGALILIVSVALSATYETDQEVTLKKGEVTVVEGWQLTFEGMRAEETPQRYEIKPLVSAEKNGSVEKLIPQMNYYPNSREPIGTPAIHSTLASDLYLTLISFKEDGSEASFRVKTLPAVAWIWIGGGIVMIGGLVALCLGRRNSPTPPSLFSLNQIPPLIIKRGLNDG